MSGENTGKPRVHYCRNITTDRLLSLWLALLLLFFGFCMCVYGGVLLGEDRSAWDYMEYGKLAVGWIAGILFLVSGFGTAYTALRDALCPQKSRLARSIRSQLPYPDSAPDVKELFDMVDRDIGENGQWFDKVAVGKEWVLGDMASYIPRIRVFFGRDEIRTHRSGERTNTSRIVELYILDDRRQTQITTLRNPRELQPLLDCISLRAPDALCRPYNEYAKWCQKSDMEWENMLREYRLKQGEREMESFRYGGSNMAIEQNMVLAREDGSVTSRVTADLIHKVLLDCLEQGEGFFTLTPGHPIEQNNIRFVGMECFAAFYEEIEDPSPQELEEFGEVELILKMTSTGAGKGIQFGRTCQTNLKTAEQILSDWLRGELPSFSNWEATPLYVKQDQEKKREIPPPHLGLMTPSGVFQSHDRFTLEDVEVAAAGIEDGTYRMVDLILKGGYLWMNIESGDKMDGRCKVSVTRADSDKLRYFRNLCTHRQAAAWLVEFAKGTFRPDWKEWKDYTRKAEKEYKKK